jgi:RNA polymerase sigma-70 factor (ECF subfamily)
MYAEVAPALYVWSALHVPAGLRAHTEPEDVIQEVWCRAFERFDSFDPSHGSFRAWVFGIARNVMLEELRAAAKSSERPDLDEIAAEATSISERVARNESVQRLLCLSEHLPGRERQLLMYRGLEGLSYAEVGERLGLSSEAARSLWRRLRDRLAPVSEANLPRGTLTP